MCSGVNLAQVRGAELRRLAQTQCPRTRRRTSAAPTSSFFSFSHSFLPLFLPSFSTGVFPAKPMRSTNPRTRIASWSRHLSRGWLASQLRMAVGGWQDTQTRRLSALYRHNTKLSFSHHGFKTRFPRRASEGGCICILVPSGPSGVPSILDVVTSPPTTLISPMSESHISPWVTSRLSVAPPSRSCLWLRGSWGGRLAPQLRSCRFCRGDEIRAG